MRFTSPRGFTLIEVVIATGIVVTIALGTAQLFAIAIQHNLQARRQLAMSLLAARKADDLAVAVAAGAAPAAGGALDRSIGGFADAVVDSGAAYVRRWTVQPVGGRAGLLAVVVRVTGAARAGPGPGSVQIATICGAAPP
jgi:prepilin-type N-terminal cleavage/methylation domain-containing protein